MLRLPSGRSRIGIVLLAVAALVAPAGGAVASPSPARGPFVRTSGGWVRGAAAGTTAEYLGIPYAAPPVGALRWSPPRPAARWAGVRSATSYAPHCPQPASPFGVASTSEDCLYLNVFAPAGDRNRDLPVMVWVHGGSLLETDYSVEHHCSFWGAAA